MNSTTGLTPTARILLLLAGASVTLWGMSNYAAYINSAALAVLLALAFGPLIDWLRRSKLPNWASLLITLAVAVVVLGALGFFFVYSAAQFAFLLPTYKEQAEALVQEASAWLQSIGLDAAGSGALGSSLDPSAPLDFVSSLLSGLSELLGNTVTMILLMVFLFVDVILFPGRLAWHAANSSQYAQRVREFTGDLRQYMVVMVILGVIVAACNTVLFWLVGVDLPLLWGVLSGILNFIPFIGFWFGLIAPAVLTLLESGLWMMLLMSAVYILINAVISNVIQPKLVVVRLNLTPFFNLVSCTFWPLVLGPAGAIIGVPLTMGVYSLLLNVDPSTRWLANLMGATLPEQAQEGATNQKSPT